MDVDIDIYINKHVAVAAMIRWRFSRVASSWYPIGVRRLRLA
jgi:hypothetical protein